MHFNIHLMQVRISVIVPSSRKLGTRIFRNRPVPSRKLGIPHATGEIRLFLSSHKYVIIIVELYLNYCAPSQIIVRS